MMVIRDGDVRFIYHHIYFDFDKNDSSSFGDILNREDKLFLNDDQLNCCDLRSGCWYV